MQAKFIYVMKDYKFIITILIVIIANSLSSTVLSRNVSYEFYNIYQFCKDSVIKNNVIVGYEYFPNPKEYKHTTCDIAYICKDSTCASNNKRIVLLLNDTLPCCGKKLHYAFIVKIDYITEKIERVLECGTNKEYAPNVEYQANGDVYFFSYELNKHKIAKENRGKSYVSISKELFNHLKKQIENPKYIKKKVTRSSTCDEEDY